MKYDKSTGKPVHERAFLDLFDLRSVEDVLKLYDALRYVEARDVDPDHPTLLALSLPQITNNVATLVAAMRHSPIVDILVHDFASIPRPLPRTGDPEPHPDDMAKFTTDLLDAACELRDFAVAGLAEPIGSVRYNEARNAWMEDESIAPKDKIKVEESPEFKGKRIARDKRDRRAREAMKKQRAEEKRQRKQKE